MSTLSRLFRHLFGPVNGPQLCILCDRPITHGLRCQNCRRESQFQAFLRKPIVTQQGAATHHRYHEPTQEELNDVPF